MLFSSNQSIATLYRQCRSFLFHRVFGLALTGLIIISICSYLWADSNETTPTRPLQSAIDLSGPINFCGEPVPLDHQQVKERFEKELMLALWDRPQVILWLKRAPRFMPLIEKELKKNNLPQDLKYIPVVESAFLSYLGSSKGALGYWQFMEGSGRKYGLTITAGIDQRRNLQASTKAAILYLQELHKTFGNWTLAAAGFNMGHDGLLAEVTEQRTRNYYRLYLPIETQRYLFRILCAKLIFENPEKYGFVLDDKDLYPPIKSESVTIDCIEDTPIWLIAQAAQTDFKEIKELNPEVRGHYLVSGIWQIAIPPGQSKGFSKRFNALLKTWQTQRQEHVYIIQKGDNLSNIAERFNVPLSSLLIWNRIDLSRPIHPGDRLIIHQQQDKSD